MTPQYIAGFFDGEGSVSIATNHTKTSRKNYYLKVQIANTFKDLLDQIKDNYGGYIWEVKKKTSHHKQSYVWVVVSRQAERFLTDILPHLLIKKPQALLGLEFQKRLTTGGGKLKKEEKDFRINTRNSMIELNGRFLNYIIN